ncbi:hypothetical protein CDAR_619721 [Caerostris darwini]|uniref:Uncharacterized protein n=1 Tax=Caerostris darwini TaxID=1538125 RepID=A0AAV4SEA1_9ARAC|nr:hypothetical protein CDAR_619721 [Caerostris darwini]
MFKFNPQKVLTPMSNQTSAFRLICPMRVPPLCFDLFDLLVGGGERLPSCSQQVWGTPSLTDNWCLCSQEHGKICSPFSDHRGALYPKRFNRP